MRHGVDGRKFGMRTSHRKAMFKIMAVNLIEHEQIKTTVHKAKELRRVVDRLITLGKNDTLNSKRLAFARTGDKATVTKLFKELSVRYAKRNGGYTRVLKIDGVRTGDGAEMALIELVDRPVTELKKKAKKAKAAAAHDHEGHDHDHDHDHGDAKPAKKEAKKAAPKTAEKKTEKKTVAKKNG